ncbi:MAG TPA: hypothetical protein PK991_09730 [Candidatus Sabulitectum sp.]|nr:hypothetical protein [Candidatus Sabulitectum sp.]
MPMERPFLLWVKSAFSFRWGTETPEVLAGRIAAAGYAGGLLADTGGVYGTHRYAEAASDAGIRALAGAEVHGAVFGALSSGWGQLCRLVTSAHLPERVSPEEALGDSGNLYAIAANPGAAGKLIERGFRGKVYLPVLPGEADPDCPPGMLPLACAPSMYCREGSSVVHSILRKYDRLLPEPHVQSPPMNGCTEALPGWHGGMWSRAPFSLENNLRLGEITCSLPLRSPYRPPVITQDDPGALKALLFPRLRSLYSGSEAAEKRLIDELRDLSEAGLCGYFLVFHRILEYCSGRRILAVARGSAAGSLVSRLLGLSAVCPIRHGLSFTRFFNRLRDDPPDIDLDIDGSLRDQVYKWFLREWGERTAAVSATVTYRTRSAVRVACAALGVSRDETDILATLSGSTGDPIWKQPLPGEVLRRSKLLLGLPSHLMPHPCGVVVGQGLIASTVPVEMCSGGLPVTQLDMHGVEYTGLIKMDLLGQRGLTSLALASRGSPGASISGGGSLGGKTLELVSRGRTIGVPHIESPAMRGLLRRMTIRSVEDVARALALVRPGAASGGGRERYMTGGERDVPEPLRNILRENRGVMLYQENVSEAASILLGLDPAGGDLMRRKLKKKSVSREEMITLCEERGHSRRTAERGWDLLSGYAGYGFCKAHAMTYAAVACAYAGIKAERPAEAMAAFLAAGGGFYRHMVYVEEARRLGITILPPDVNRAEWFYSSSGDGGLIIGMGCLAGMGETEFEKLKAGRPYTHPVQVRAAGLGPRLAMNMAMAGCFDSLGMNRPQAAWCITEGATTLFPFGMPPPPLPGYTPAVRAAKELELMEVTTEAHPLAFQKRPEGTVPLCREELAGNGLVWGRVLTKRSLGDGAGFLMLEDDTGVADLFVPSPWYRKVSIILRRPGAAVTLRCRRTGERTAVAGVAGD